MFRNLSVVLLLAAWLAGTAGADLEKNLFRLASTTEGKVGIVFIDLKGTREVRVKGDDLFPAASVAKVPVMAAAYHLFDSGKLDLGQKILFIEGDKLGGSGVLQWMKGGQEYTLWNLIRLMIVLSDNTATKLVVDNVGLPAINDYLNGIGLKNTVIVDPTMLKEPPASDINRTTPLDLARLMVKIQKAEGFYPKSRKEMIAFMRNQRYRWGIWRGVPPGTVVANKTGNLEGVLNDVGIIYTKKGNYVLSIFTWGFKKQRQARLLINEISRVTYEEYTGEKVERAMKAVKAKKQKVIKRKLRRRPSAKLRRRSGRRGSVSDHRSRTYRRR
jgi:beta-lactamase class A